MMNSNGVEDKIKKIYTTISLVNKDAYKDIFLFSNHVLSKSPFNNNLLNNYLNGKNVKKTAVYAVIFKLLVYYIKSSLHFMLYIFKFAEQHFSLLKFCPSKRSEELIVIDASFINEKILQQGKFQDLFFTGLKEVLEKKEKHYAYLPFFYSASYHKRPLELYRILKILKKENLPVITEFQLFTLLDLLRILYFIFTYPFCLLRVVVNLKPNTYELRLLKSELIDTLDQVTFYNFSRFLLGRKILRLPYKNFKVISWYENQPLHKNLYRGLRTEAQRVIIYGAQLFLYSKKFISIEPDENEEVFGVIPDWIISNGPFYIGTNSRFRYRIGPSLRSRNVFRTTVVREKQNDIIVLLPFYKCDTENILRIISDTRLSKENIFLKGHPAIPIEKYKHLVPDYVTVTNEDAYRLFETAKIVISASSGTLLEASSLGIPVISIKDNKHFDFYNPLPEYGKGIIWEEAESSEELIRHIDKFSRALKENIKEITAIANRYKDMFFCKISDENISMAFDL